MDEEGGKVEEEIKSRSILCILRRPYCTVITGGCGGGVFIT